MNQGKREQFFKELAVCSRTADIESVKNVYFGFIKTIVHILKDKGECNLPDFGKFYLHIFKSKRMIDVITREIRISPAAKILKFMPDRKLKKFIRHLK